MSKQETQKNTASEIMANLVFAADRYIASIESFHEVQSRSFTPTGDEICIAERVWMRNMRREYEYAKSAALQFKGNDHDDT